MKKLSSVTISGGLTVDQATTLSGVVSVGGIGTGAYTSVLVRNSSNQMLYRNYSDFLNDISGSLNLSGYVPTSRTITINGTTYDLSANRTWTISTVDYTSRLQHVVKAGVAINKGQAVYVTSADGTNMIVGLASNASEATSSKTMGLLDATVSTNGFANVVTEGLLAGLDTSTAGTEGDPVWLGTGGNLIYGLINKPYAPAHLVFIGIVTRKNSNNGEIFVKVQNGFELNEIHDVDLKTNLPVNGELLGFNGTLWVNKTIAGWLGYTPANASGTTNYISKFTGSTTLGNSQIFDNGTNVGIGTTSPGDPLHIVTSGSDKFIRIENTNLYTGLWLNDGGTNSGWLVLSGYTDTASPGDFAIREYGVQTSLTIKQTTGNVGIGTTSPTLGLHIADGKGLLVGPSGASGSMYVSPSDENTINGSYGIASDTADIWLNYRGYQDGFSYFRDTRIGNGRGTAILMVDGSEGNVGIGTTSPTGKLQIADDGPNALVLGSTQISTIGETNDGGYPGMKIVPYNSNIHIGISSTNDNRINLWHGGSNYTYWQQLSTYSVISNYSTNALVFQVHGGNVGIGTTSPSYKLQVNADGAGLYVLGANTAPYTQTIASFVYGGNGNSINIENQGGKASIQARAGASSMDLILNAAGSNVGIGTASPASKLHVVGPINIERTGVANVYSTVDMEGNFRFNASGGYAHTFLNNGSELVRIMPSGNVGIGTTSPSRALNIVSNNAQIRISDNTAPTTNYWEFSSVYFNTNQDLFISNQSGTAITLNASLNVGIGTTAPEAKLHIVSGSGQAGFLSRGINGDTWFPYSNGQNYVRGVTNFDLGSVYFTGGNIGIGTSSPNQKLSVEGGSIQLNANNAAANYYLFLNKKSGQDGGILFNRDNASDWQLTNGAGNGDLIFYSYGTGTEAITFKRGTGNVGIGTTSPGSKLTVFGNNDVFSVISQTGDTSFATRLLAQYVGLFNNGANGHHLYVSSTQELGPAEFNLTKTWGGFLTFGVSSDGTARTRALYVNSNGYVGVNVNPISGDRFEVAGSVRIHTGNNWDAIQIYSDGANGYIQGLGDETGLRIRSEYGNILLADNRGNVGISTTTPQKKLDVNGTGIVASFGGTFSPGAFAGLHFGYSESASNNDSYKKSALVFERTDNHGQGGNASGKIHFLLNNIASASATSLSHSVMVIDTDSVATQGSARVGIGTTSPSTALTVNGVITATGGNSTNWNTAYGWGNHATAGYLTSYSETDTLNSVTSRGASTSNAITVGATTINGVWQTNISTVGGWSKLSFTASNAWGDGTTYGTLGASGGNEPGVMIYNMHATWAGSSQGAGIRMGRSGGVAGGSWYQVATMDSDEFMIAKNGQWSNGGIKITSGGELQHGNSGNKYWHAGNDGSGSGLDADLLDGQNSTEFLRLLSGGAEANLDSYTDNGFRSVSFPGHSQHLLSWNAGGSTGTVQQLFHYGTPNNGWRIRNKTDNTSWSDWGYVVMASSNQGLISGTIATQSWVGSQSYATTSYVTTQINNLINGAPGVLDTLDELAAALGDDANFATTVTNSIAGKVSKAGDTMTSSGQQVLNIFHGAATGDFNDALFVKNTVSEQQVQIGMATTGSDGDHHRVSLRAYKGAQALEGVFGIALRQPGSAAHTQRLTLDYLGNLTIGGFLTESSSLKLKENVETSEGNLEKVVNLRPVTFNKIGSQTTELGLIAEEVAEVYPEFVQYDENGEPIGVNYSRLTAALIGAVKQLTQRIETLEKNG